MQRVIANSRHMIYRSTKTSVLASPKNKILSFFSFISSRCLSIYDFANGFREGQATFNNYHINKPFMNPILARLRQIIIAHQMDLIYAPISLGELIDKISILQIKSVKFNGEKLINVRKELNCLEKILSDLDLNFSITELKGLSEINNELWDIEDELRHHEKQKLFDSKFIELARNVYILNDKRAAIKKSINIRHDCCLVEEKSYSKYT